MVLSVDEKSQSLPPRRRGSRRSTAPSRGCPIKKGRAGTMTHDYKRHGTTSLFAALDVATGAVIGQCMKRHRHQEFLRFLRTIDRHTPPKLDLHLVLDNYATHKHAPRCYGASGEDKASSSLDTTDGVPHAAAE
jgi:DDE superfamily endonuclease